LKLKAGTHKSSPQRFYINHLLPLYISKIIKDKQELEILDIGCGSGGNSYFFQDFSGSYLGIDIKSSNGWKIKRRGQINLEFKQLDGHFIDEIKKKFDLIIAITSFEHIKNDKLVIQKSYDLLKDNSKMMIIVPSKFAFLLYGYHGYRYYNKKYIKKLANSSRFEIEKIQKIGGLISYSFHLFVNAFTLIRKKMISIFNRVFKKKIPLEFRFFGNKKPAISKLNKELLMKSKKFDNFFPIFENGYIVIFKKN